jgi:ABC transporter substrate binding protein
MGGAKLAPGTENAPPRARSQPNLTAFLQALQQLGWADGRNMKIDYRWPVADADKIRKYAAELAALAPDVILAISSPSLASLLQATRTVPIVFVAVADPVGAGFVESLSRPGGNATGFINFEYSIGSQTLAVALRMPAFDPKRTFGARSFQQFRPRHDGRFNRLHSDRIGDRSFDSLHGERIERLHIEPGIFLAGSVEHINAKRQIIACESP